MRLELLTTMALPWGSPVIARMGDSRQLSRPFPFWTTEGDISLGRVQSSDELSFSINISLLFKLLWMGAVLYFIIAYVFDGSCNFFWQAIIMHWP